MAAKETVSLSARLIEILGRHRKVLIWGLGIFVVALIATFAYLEIQQRRAEDALSRIEDTEELYQTWVEALDGEDTSVADELRVELEEDLQEIISRYSRRYAANRAYFLQGQVYWQLEDWSSAGEAFRETADNFPESHLASVSLYNAAAAFEQAGNLEDATETFERLVDDYAGEPTPIVPQAVFSLGRIAEEQGEYATAEERYQELVENHPGSSWTSLARSRIILLTAEGRIN